VLAAALGLFVLRHRERPSQDAAGPAALVLADPATGGASSGQVGATPLPPWSAAGVEDFAFTERSGRKVTKADLLGHPWLISFIFTRCAGPCPRVSGQMGELQTLLKGTDVRLVTLTVDPDFDTTDVLSHYAEGVPRRSKPLALSHRRQAEDLPADQQQLLMPVKEYTGKDREPGYEVMHSTSILLVNEKAWSSRDITLSTRSTWPGCDET